MPVRSRTNFDFAPRSTPFVSLVVSPVFARGSRRNCLRQLPEGTVDSFACIVQADDPLLVRTVLAQSAVEALDCPFFTAYPDG